MVAAALLQAERRQEGEDHDAHRNPVSGDDGAAEGGDDADEARPCPPCRAQGSVPTAPQAGGDHPDASTLTEVLAVHGDVTSTLERVIRGIRRQRSGRSWSPRPHRSHPTPETGRGRR